MSIKGKTIFFVITSAILVGASLAAYYASNINLANINKANLQLNREILNEANNKRKIQGYLNYKRDHSIKNLKVEPVNISAKFSSTEDLTRLDKIIDDTYRKKGFFFLSGFLLKTDSDKKKGITISMSGNKIILLSGK